ncbi:GlsB/YeaQ/YmgE family stress response membrane protein [Ilumatobacter nonamiensis]|uniref:GlsB/YeaQ/YmgE family stress response membrane protein n=1 Tax=Ilumatobacter nonamiensis TaxID=467093 RepID=UPI0005913D8B|nr:GlsB/YeaQ/YmgE family stress response membrane protein [Ilumatobacter nonamiensis]
MLILALIVAGMLVGWLAQFILGRSAGQTDWMMAFVAGIVGSFVGGLLFSLINGDGLDIAPSGLIGSLVGALIVTAIWQAYNKKQRAADRAPDAKPWE